MSQQNKDQSTFCCDPHPFMDLVALLDSHALLKAQLLQLTADLKTAIAEQKNALPSSSLSLWQVSQIGSGACLNFTSKPKTNKDIELLRTPSPSIPSFEKKPANPYPPHPSSRPQTAQAPATFSTLAQTGRLATKASDSPEQPKEKNLLESASFKKKEIKKIGSFTLESPPPPPAYDLQEPEKWFQQKGVQKANHPVRSSSVPGPISKSARLPPIVILYKAPSSHLEALEKLKNALVRSFLPTICVSDTPSTRQALLDAFECKRVHLLLLGPGFESTEVFFSYPQTKKIEASQLEEPQQKLELWKSISEHLSKPIS